MVEAIELNAIDIHKNFSDDIDDLITRIKREQQSGNVLLMISGKPQTGKTNTALKIASEISHNYKWTFNFREVFRICTDMKNAYAVVVYDEIQQDITNWYDIAFKIAKQLLESYGFMHIVLIMVSPRLQNLFSLIELVHYTIRCKKVYNRANKRFDYYAHCYLSEDDIIRNKMILVEFEIKHIHKIDKKTWNRYMEVKVENYKKRVTDWQDELDTGISNKHRHYFLYSVSKNLTTCRICGYQIKGKLYDNFKDALHTQKGGDNIVKKSG